MTKTREDSALVPIFPSRKIFFRENNKRVWRRHTFTILGKKGYLAPVRASRPMQLTLETDVDGFRLVEIVGLDLFSAIASALLSVESVMLHLRYFGEVRLNETEVFDIETDTVFFSSRVQKLKCSFESRAGPDRR